MFCSDKTGSLTQNILTIESKLPWCETSEQELLSFALLALEWTQNAKDAIDPSAVSRLVKARFSVD